MRSLIKELGGVRFPEHTGEKVYMVPFNKSEGLPDHLARWQPTVDDMLKDVHANGTMYLMIDQGVVSPTASQRRSGAHVDGNWVDGVRAHRGDGGGRHSQTSDKHVSQPGVWNSENFGAEGLILASDVTASCAYVGELEGHPLEGGDCSHLDLSKTERVPLIGGRAYIGNVTMVHESLPHNIECKRTLVRINVPGITF